MPRQALILTTNGQKYQEYRSYLALYGIQATQTSPDLDPPDLIAQDDIFVVLREESALSQTGSWDDLLQDMSLPTSCYNLAYLTVYLKNQDPITYNAKVKGFLNPSLAQKDLNVFGWDDIFQVQSTGLTYQAMKALRLKRSARDILLGTFAKNHLFYKQRRDLAYAPITPLHGDQTLFFNAIPFLQSHDFFKDVYQDNGSEVSALLKWAVMKGGVFFRAADNRRLGTYWAPGYNAGVPLTKKKDAFHEATFMMHDFMHFAFPDLAVVGSTPGSIDQKVYTAHRMMGEAFTLTLADMIFVDQWKQKGFAYDYGKRRIQPIYMEIMQHNPNTPLTDILWANVQMCLLADSSGLKALGVQDDTLVTFKEKYDQFFVSDFRWTQANFLNVTQDNAHLSDWLQWTQQLKPLGIHVQTAADFSQGAPQDASPQDLVKWVFQKYVARLQEVLTEAQSLTYDVAQQTQMAFARYMMGQMVMTYRYGFHPASQAYRDAITKLLLQGAAQNKVKSLWAAYLTILKDGDIITGEELTLYTEIYPMFDPFYVNYDTFSGETLAQVSQALLS